MSEQKFTTAPWQVVDDDSLYISAPGKGKWIAQIMKHEEAESNAHLIASAPSMASYIKRKAEEGDAEAEELFSEHTIAHNTGAKRSDTTKTTLAVFRQMTLEIKSLRDINSELYEALENLACLCDERDEEVIAAYKALAKARGEAK